MRISERQFNLIFEQYLKKLRENEIAHGITIPEIAILKKQYATAFKNAIEFLEQEIRDDLLDLDKIDSNDKSFDLLYQFLNRSLLVPKDKKPVESTKKWLKVSKQLFLIQNYLH